MCSIRTELEWRASSHRFRRSSVRMRKSRCHVSHSKPECFHEWRNKCLSMADSECLQNLVKVRLFINIWFYKLPHLDEDRIKVSIIYSLTNNIPEIVLLWSYSLFVYILCIGFGAQKALKMFGYFKMFFKELIKFTILGGETTILVLY